MSSAEFRHIVRIAGRDLSGTKKVVAALTDIRGVGYSLAQAVLNLAKIDGRSRLGSLSEDQLKEIEASIRDLSKIGAPAWLMNRRKDIETGTDRHLIGADLDLTIKTDIDRERSVGSWRGWRHSLGLKVRGQRTRTTGRKGRAVGVKKAELRVPTEEKKE